MICINELQTQTLETLTAEILILKRQTAANIIEIGKRLIEAKKLVGHGNWLAYLREQVQFSERTARNFMRAAEEFSNRQPVADLEPSKVYLLLEAPEEVRDELAAKAADMTKRELEAAVREANRLRKEAEEAKRRAEAAEAKAKELENRPPQIVERTVVKEVVKPDPELARQHEEVRRKYDDTMRQLEQTRKELESLRAMAEKDASLAQKIKAKEERLRELTALVQSAQPVFDDEGRDPYGGLKLMSVIRALESPVFDAVAQVRVLKRDGVGGWCDDARVREMSRHLRFLADALDEILQDRESRPILAEVKEVSD